MVGISHKWVYKKIVLFIHISKNACFVKVFEVKFGISVIRKLIVRVYESFGYKLDAYKFNNPCNVSMSPKMIFDYA